MITNEFRKKVEEKVGCAVILAGSGSDEPYIERIVLSLKRYEIPLEVRIASAHKQSKKLGEIISEYDALNGPLVYITVAGGTDALSGEVSYHSYRPTISCPPDHLNMSCLMNPPGSSNAYIALPQNVGKCIAQIFSSINTNYKKTIQQEVAYKREALDNQDNELRTKYSGVNHG